MNRSMTTRAYRAHSPSVLGNTLALLAALVVLPTTRAQQCFEDGFGNVHCSLSNGARIGIAIAIVVAFTFLAIVIGASRRRRIRRANQAYVIAQQQQQTFGNPYAYGNAPYDPTNAQYPQQPPQYPPAGQEYYNQQGYQGAYVPPQGSLSGGQHYNNYEPPRSPPPAKV